MDTDRSLNLLGAFALSLTDAVNSAIAAETGQGGETCAAIVSLGTEPGISINRLRQILNLSHPGTVRLVDRLVAQNLVERRSGTDGRTVALFLTAAGIDRRQVILDQRRSHLQLAMNSLTFDEQQQLTILLEKMLTQLTTSESRGDAICRLCEEEVCPGDRCPVEQQCRQMVNP
ncbi:winged helix-turn-helix transcriptional regulator [Microcoleus sp. FACHB-1515]|uniref:MarR family winged helix-turn-helix transcriptional regulator n=1 Tax=Cyanophyceae TaxID=3028117 RepID=UPI001682CD3D|nr:MarR family winged helix-turn-helix transcriptional regulator [Microcoleus sp. FACHB-1515]MBD2092136.1 winged helix-turn-helix transcriptional regulator [Microcoleus sp. FACHB-1515]